MRQATIRFTVIMLLAAVCPPVLDSLGVGDQAPPLVITDWVKGDPVDLRREAGGRIHMVEFWATWCPPCKASVPRLTQFQQKFKDDLTIIGVTAPDDRGNTPSAIRRFAKKQGPNMHYTVAIDKDMATTNAYMGAAGVVAIPHAFIVGKKGTILWQGSPLDPSLDQILAEVVDGSYDLNRAKVQAEVERRFQALDYSAQMGQWSAVWDGLIGILQLDPANAVAMELLMQVYISQTRDVDAFRAWAGAHIAANRGNALAMQRLAATLSANGDLTTRMPDLALEAARAAYEASAGRDARSILVYARAVYQIGDLDRAIALQEEALTAAGEADHKVIRETLDFFMLCKRLRDASS